MIASVLKPQDIVILLHLTTKQGRPWSFDEVHRELNISTSEVHAALKRAAVARLYEPKSRVPQAHALAEFCVFGLKYVFPAVLGGSTRGIGTCSGSSFSFPFTFEKSDTPVWPHSEGLVRGPAVKPLYHSIPAVILKLQKLYYFLVLVDFIRLGRAREQSWAAKTLTELLENGRVYGAQP